MNQHSPKPVRVALLGCGVVGSQVARLLLEHVEQGVDEPGSALRMLFELRSRSAEPRRTCICLSGRRRSARGTYFDNRHISLLQDGEVSGRVAAQFVRGRE